VEALRKTADQEFDLVLLDISMPGRSGLEVLKELKSSRPKLAVLMLSMYPEEQYAVRALRSGASGYLTKDSAPDELITAIRKVISGKHTSALRFQKAWRICHDRRQAGPALYHFVISFISRDTHDFSPPVDNFPDQAYYS
jgi:two-component system, NarL family, invasion response regulator UvrY